MPDLVPPLFVLACLAFCVLALRTQERRDRERDERAGRVGGFGLTGREQSRRKAPPPLTAVDVLLALVAGGALLALLGVAAGWIG